MTNNRLDKHKIDVELKSPKHLSWTDQSVKRKPYDVPIKQEIIQKRGVERRTSAQVPNSRKLFYDSIVT